LNGNINHIKDILKHTRQLFYRFLIRSQSFPGGNGVGYIIITFQNNKSFGYGKDNKMKKLLFVLLGICAGIFIIGGAFTLLGVIFSLTFGLVGTVFNWLFKVLFTPAVLVLIILFLVYKLSKKKAY